MDREELLKAHEDIINAISTCSNDRAQNILENELRQVTGRLIELKQLELKDCKHSWHDNTDKKERVCCICDKSEERLYCNHRDSSHPKDCDEDIHGNCYHCARNMLED